MKSKLKSWVLDYWLIGLIVLSTFIIFYGLGSRSLDGDEAVVLRLTNQPFINFWHSYILDVHPPLHHILTWLSIHIFGVSEWSLRLVPALSGILLSIVVYYFGKDMFNQKVGIMAGFITAASPYLLYFNQENRMYSLFILLTTISFWQLYLFFKNNQTKNGIYWILAATTSAWTQHLGLFLGLVLGIIALVMSKKKTLVLGLALIGIILYLPIARQTVGQFTGRLGEQSPADYKSNIVGLSNAYYRFVPGRIFLDLNPSPKDNIAWAKQSPVSFIFFVFTLVVPTILFIFGLLQLYKKERSIFWYLILPSLSLVLLALVSGEIGGRAARYLSVLSPIMFLIISFGISLMSQYKKIISLILLAIILFSGIYIQYSREQKSVGAKQIAQFLSTHVAWGDGVVVRGALLGGEETALTYYLAQIPNAPKLAITDFYANYKPGNLNKLSNQKSEAIIQDSLKQHQRVWYYDMSYQNDVKLGKVYPIGLDKENKLIEVREIKR